MVHLLYLFLKHLSMVLYLISAFLLAGILFNNNDNDADITLIHALPATQDAAPERHKKIGKFANYPIHPS